MKTLTMMMLAAGCAFGALADDYSFAYQGALRHDSGKAFSNETITATIRLYDKAEGGTCFWATRATSMTSEDGTFNLEVADAPDGKIGDVVYPPLREAMAKNSSFYLGLTVDDTAGEIVPRQKVIAVPQALFAQDVREASGDFVVKGDATIHGDIHVSSSGDAASRCSLANGQVKAQSLVVGAAHADAMNVTQDLDVNRNAKVNGELTVDTLAVKGTSVTAPNAALTVQSLAVGSSNFTVNGLDVAVPIGVIVMWYGDENDVPAGWAICNGQTVNGFKTPNLTGRFVVGAGADSTYKASDGGDAYRVGTTGGERTHKLSTEEMPSHAHSVTMHTGDVVASWKDQRNFYMPWAKYPGTSTETTTAAGGGVAHENRPPYHALYYIMKVR